MPGQEGLGERVVGERVLGPLETVAFVGEDDVGHGQTKLLRRGDDGVALGQGAAHVVRSVGDQHRLGDPFGPAERRAGAQKFAAFRGARGAAAWVGTGGRARKLRDAEVTAGRHKVGAVLCVKAKDMKEAWCLVASDAEASAREIMNSYAKRWTIEPGFRDTKDLRFGMGLSVLRIADPQRRDRLLLLNAFAIVLLTLLGAAGESLGMDRHLKVNTAKHRTHSLFWQGCMLYELIPNMPEVRLRPLVERFSEYITQNRALAQTFSVV